MSSNTDKAHSAAPSPVANVPASLHPLASTEVRKELQFGFDVIDRFSARMGIAHPEPLPKVAGVR